MGEGGLPRCKCTPETGETPGNFAAFLVAPPQGSYFSLAETVSEYATQSIIRIEGSLYLERNPDLKSGVPDGSEDVT